MKQQKIKRWKIYSLEHKLIYELHGIGGFCSLFYLHLYFGTHILFIYLIINALLKITSITEIHRFWNKDNRLGVNRHSAEEGGCVWRCCRVFYKRKWEVKWQSIKYISIYSWLYIGTMYKIEKVLHCNTLIIHFFKVLALCLYW